MTEDLGDTAAVTDMIRAFSVFLKKVPRVTLYSRFDWEA